MNPYLAEGTATYYQATLLTKVNMYGELWTHGQALQILIGQEVHHRGQMTVLTRQAGLRVPVYSGLLAKNGPRWAWNLL
ncbi:DinB family protein [Paenibacillus sp. FSL H7-0331]|uniref:DinB family protein n=1 Tax=Paenibacillus sp. FSL H7-0331 TaxID=1920421 RepID=UPI00096E5747|nr:hypothetical protein BK127_33230 [Paenibacillus sp. FSL H7-0331]